MSAGAPACPACPGPPTRTQRVVQALNRRLSDLGLRFHLPLVPAYPRYASVEATNACNLRCPVCEGRTVSRRTKGFMSLERFGTVMAEIGPFLERVALYNWGESFLNRDIYEMIRLVRTRYPGCYVYFDTNGHFMDASRLAACPPHEVVFSIDGFDQETYATYRVKGCLATVLENLRACVAAKRARGGTLPRLVVKFIVMRHNEHQLAQVPRFAEDVGADGYRIEAFTSRTVAHARQFMSTRPEYQRYDPAELARDRLVPFARQLPTPCADLWSHMDVRWNGDVSPCCTDYGGDETWGNVFEPGGVRRVWNGPAARRFRSLHRRGLFRERIPICRSCYLTNVVPGCAAAPPPPPCARREP